MDVTTGLAVFGIFIAVMAYCFGCFKLSNLVADKYGNAWGLFSWMVLGAGVLFSVVAAFVAPHIP